MLLTIYGTKWPKILCSYDVKKLLTHPFLHTVVCLSSVSWLGGVAVRTLDLRSIRGRGFDSPFGRYQVVATWMGDCLWTGKPFR